VIMVTATIRIVTMINTNNNASDTLILEMRKLRHFPNVTYLLNGFYLHNTHTHTHTHTHHELLIGKWLGQTRQGLWDGQ
jgi:hypothetical protein